MKRTAFAVFFTAAAICTVSIQSASTQSAVILEAIYATSTAPNFEKFDPHNLFGNGG